MDWVGWIGLGWIGSPGGRGYRAPYGANNTTGNTNADDDGGGGVGGDVVMLLSLLLLSLLSMMMTLYFNQMQMFSTDTSHWPADKVTLCKQLHRDELHNDHYYDHDHDYEDCKNDNNSTAGEVGTLQQAAMSCTKS